MNRLVKLLTIFRSPALIQALVKYGVAAGVEHLKVLRSLGPIETVVDIGANRGQFALAAREVFPQARILSIEPLDEPAGIFRKVFASDKITHLQQTAVGNENAKTTIHVSQSDDSSSLLPISEIQNELFPNTAEMGQQTVQVQPLGNLVKKADLAQPAMLKIDVQGYELQVLLGSQKLIDQFAFIYVECSFMELYTGQALAYEVIAWLDTNRFSLSGVYNMNYNKNGEAIQGDFLFKRIDGKRVSGA